MTIDDPRERVTIGLEDLEGGTIRVGINWVCHIVECGQIPIAVIALAKHIDRQRQKKEK